MTTTTVRCPYDGTPVDVELTFEGDPPYFHLEAPAMVAHMRDQHGDRTGMVAQGRPHG